MSSPCPRLLLVGFAALGVIACEREQRRFSEFPPSASPTTPVREVQLHAGPPTRTITVRNAYEENAYAVAEGKRLFNQFNCSGCHFQGGGGIGPPLMDDKWIYGSEPQNIFETIVEGRPNGMPSFQGRLSDQQIWQLVAYVRSMSGLVPKDVAPGRDDHMQVKAQEQQMAKPKPKQSFQPPSTERP